MATNLGALGVFLTANTTPFQRSMFQAQKSILSLKNTAAVAGAAIGAAVTAFSVSSIKFAASAEETANRFDVVFSDIGDAAQAAAKDIGDSFDLARSTTKGMLGSTGDLLTGLGFTQKAALELSVRVARLAGDIASFSNIQGGAAEAARRLTKGILGETENLNELGVKIRQDTKEFKDLVASIQEAEGATLSQAKALAILRMSAEQSKNSIGDYSRTSDSFSNQVKQLAENMKDLKEEWGRFLIEGLKLPELLQKINGILESISWESISGDIGKFASAIFESVRAANELKNELLELAGIDMSGGGGELLQTLTNPTKFAGDMAKALADTLKKRRELGELGERMGKSMAERFMDAVQEPLKFPNRITKTGKDALPVFEFQQGVGPEEWLQESGLEQDFKDILEAEKIWSKQIQDQLRQTEFRPPEPPKIPERAPGFATAIEATSQAAIAIRTQGFDKKAMELKLYKDSLEQEKLQTRGIQDIYRRGIPLRDVGTLGTFGV
jgi:hypothetical protein